MLKDTIKKDMITAMKEKNSIAKNALRGLLSAITNKLVADGKLPSDEASDELVLSVIKTEVKRRKDSISQFTEAGRPELAESEKKELDILSKYLPETMSKEEIKKIAIETKEELNINDKTKFGMLIGAVLKKTAGKAEGDDVKEVVMSLFE